MAFIYSTYEFSVLIICFLLRIQSLGFHVCSIFEVSVYFHFYLGFPTFRLSLDFVFKASCCFHLSGIPSACIPIFPVVSDFVFYIFQFKFSGYTFGLPCASLYSKKTKKQFLIFQFYLSVTSLSSGSLYPYHFWNLSLVSVLLVFNVLLEVPPIIFNMFILFPTSLLYMGYYFLCSKNS